MKKTLLAGLVALGLACVAAPAQATIITSVTAAPSNATQTYGVASVTTALAGNGGVPGVSANTITLNASLESGYVANTPFEWTMNILEVDGAPLVDGNTKYFVTMNLLNNGVNPLSVTHQMFNLGPVTGTILNGATAGPNTFVSPSSPFPTSSIGAASVNGADLTFVNALAFNPGDTAVLNFTIDLADYTNGTGTSIVDGAFTLSMVANPEPTSLALAGLAMSAGGFGAFRRRRKMKAAAADAATTPAVDA